MSRSRRRSCHRAKCGLCAPHKRWKPTRKLNMKPSDLRRSGGKRPLTR